MVSLMISIKMTMEINNENDLVDETITWPNTIHMRVHLNI